MRNTDVIVYFLGTFPLLSQTFIRRELLALQDAGLAIRIIAAHRGTAEGLSEREIALVRDTHYLPARLSWHTWMDHVRCFLARPVRYCRAVVCLLCLPHRSLYHRGRAVLHLPQLAPLMRALDRAGDVRHLHAHFASWQTELAIAAAAYCQIPVSFTGHAQDLYKDRNAIPWKIRQARFVLTCTEHNRRWLLEQSEGTSADSIITVYHPMAPELLTPISGDQHNQQEADTPLLLAIGRLVPKKGFTYLIEACRNLREQGRRFRVIIVGGGPLYDRLQRQIQEAGLDDVVQLTGSVSFGRVQELLRETAIFVMPSIVLPNGDRDGIPNVLVEAMAVGAPPVGTNVSGLPELIIDHQTGMLVPPGDAAALAGAVAVLLEDSKLRETMGEAAMRLVREKYAPENTGGRLVQILQQRVFGAAGS